jgi:phosphoribosylformimino-5-aminoimidazole carboxamide ribotide isomerase
MDIIPLIELQNERVVSLTQGRIAEPSIWHVDPIAKASEYAASGASLIHITDFDAVAGTGANTTIIDEIIRTSGCSVQVGGGIASMSQIEALADRGVARIVVGTAAVSNPDLIHQAAKFFPDQIVLSIDVYQGKVMSTGWQTPSQYEPEQFLDAFNRDPLAAVIVTDIDADLEQSDDQLALVTKMAQLSNAPVVARGMCRSLDDISRLKYVPYVQGTLIGRALLEKSIVLSDALAVAAAPLEKAAEFI